MVTVPIFCECNCARLFSVCRAPHRSISHLEHGLGSVTMLLLRVLVGPRNRSGSTDKRKMHHRGGELDGAMRMSEMQDPPPWEVESPS